MTRHRAALDCRPKNRKRCRRTSEQYAAASLPPAVRQTAAAFLDLEEDESFPPHPEETPNDMGLPSASSTAPHAAEWIPLRPKSLPSLPMGSFTISISHNMLLLLDDHQHPVVQRSMMWTILVSGMWESRPSFYAALRSRNTSVAPLHQPYTQRQWNLLMDQMIMRHEEPELLDAMFLTHAESPTDGISSTWSVNIKWGHYQLTCSWVRVSGLRFAGEMFGINRIFIADEKYEAAVDCRKNRRISRSGFEEEVQDPALAIPSTIPRNDMYSLGGHTAESQPSSEVPSNDTSQPSTTTASLPTTGLPHWTPPGYTSTPTIARSPTPQRNLVDGRLQTGNVLPRVSTYHGMGQQQEERTAQAEAQYRSRREPTKTTSSKDVPLDYTDANQGSLFEGTFPTVDKQHFGSTEQFPANFFSREDTSFVGGLSNSQLCMPGFPRDIEKLRPHLSMQGNALSLEPTGERTTDSTPTSLGSGSSAATPDDQLKSTSAQHTLSEFRGHPTPVPGDEGAEGCFAIARSQEPSLLILGMVRAGREPANLCITLTGNWISIESLLDDFPKDVPFNWRFHRPHWTSLWRAMMKTMTARPPRMLAEMWDTHPNRYFTITSVWFIDFKWTEEGIVVHWKSEGSHWSMTLAKPGENGVRVTERE
jgi:hypothetical protein